MNNKNNPLSYKPSEMQKAIYGSIIAVLGTLIATAADGFTVTEGLTVVLEFFLAYGFIFGVNNKGQ